jgi:hypothetical protein
VGWYIVSRSQKQIRESVQTVSTDHDVMPLLSLNIFHVVPGATSETSNFAFFSSPPEAASTTRALDVTITSLVLFLEVLPPKNRENFFGVSTAGSPVFEFGLCGCDVTVTLRLPNLSMRSLFLVSTGDQSMSN